jgi:L-ribulose-5-phosphate 3-epimerase
MTRKFDLGSSFGIMQGRLSIQTDRGYQSFPWETWEQEFELAATRGFEHIEWVLDSWQVNENPILAQTNAVRELTVESGVKVISVCADYLMDTPLDISEANSWMLLGKLASSMQDLGSGWLVIPCVDQSSLRPQSSLERFISAADRISDELNGTGIRVTLETDLGPQEFASLLTVLDPEVFGVNYDIGNSAALGYEYDEEFDAYGERISLVHVKDRILGGGSVALGEGDANIPGVIERLRDMNFNGPVTMQVFRDAEGLGVLDKQSRWLIPMLEGIA